MSYIHICECLALNKVKRIPSLRTHWNRESGKYHLELKHLAQEAIKCDIYQDDA